MGHKQTQNVTIFCLFVTSFLSEAKTKKNKTYDGSLYENYQIKLYSINYEDGVSCIDVEVVVITALDCRTGSVWCI